MRKLLVDFVGFLISSLIFGWIARKMPRSLVDNAVTGYIDNKIGTALGLTEAAADGFLSEWLAPIVLGIIAVVVWHRWASAQNGVPSYNGSVSQNGLAPPAAQRSMLEWSGRITASMRIWIARVLPIHVIIFGLVITFGGVIWLSLRAPTPDPQVAALRSELQSTRMR